MRGLPQEYKVRFRHLFTAPDNVDQLQYLICVYVRDFVFPTCPSADPVDLKLVLIRRLGQELRAAVIKKLKHYYPNDAHRNEAALLSYYPDRGIDLLQQALSHVVDIWTEDQRTHKKDSDDTLVKKCQRLLPFCTVLPELRGRSGHGRTSRLFGLAVYEDVMHLLRDLPPGAQVVTRDDETRRKQLFCRILEALRSNQTLLLRLS